MKSFRYLPSQFANRMLQRGEVLITTLYECRRKELEHHDLAHGDANGAGH